MPALSVKMQDGETISYDIATGQAGPACFALGIRKSGSSIFSNIVNALADHNQRPVVDIPSKLFDEGYRYAQWNANKGLKRLLHKGNVYIGFRDPPTIFYDDAVFHDAKKILLVRDPRDALVSEYFSNAYSHSMPTRNEDSSVISEERERALESEIGDYVLSRAKYFDNTMADYIPLLDDPNLRLMRYEDVILSKAEWIADIAKFYGWQAEPDFIKLVLGWADVVPEAEDNTQFIRRVIPGDYRNKISDQTESNLCQLLSPFWKELGYDLDG